MFQKVRIFPMSWCDHLASKYIRCRLSSIIFIWVAPYVNPVGNILDRYRLSGEKLRYFVISIHKDQVPFLLVLRGLLTRFRHQIVYLTPVDTVACYFLHLLYFWQSLAWIERGSRVRRTGPELIEWPGISRWCRSFGVSKSVTNNIWRKLLE